MNHKNQSFEDIICSLKEKGYRITKVRSHIINLLLESNSPLSVQEIISKLYEFSLKPNKTTIYRELTFLIENNLAAEIDLLEGQKRYEKVHSKKHHQHLLCVNCKKIQCVELDDILKNIEGKIKTKFKFKVSKPVFEFFGYCIDCN